MACGKNKNCGKSNRNRATYEKVKLINKEGTILTSKEGRKFRVINPKK